MAAVSQLSSIVESGKHACYGIEWQLADGILVAKEVYNPSWRIEYAARAGLKRLFTTDSKSYTFQPGAWVLVKEPRFSCQKRGSEPVVESMVFFLWQLHNVIGDRIRGTWGYRPSQ